MTSTRRYYHGVFVAGILILVSAFSVNAQATATPIVVQLASPTPLPVLGTGATSTPLPTPTETPIGPVQLTVAEGLGNVNVRREADPDSDILGVIAPGELYPVTGRYYRWLQFRFPNSPNGIGFVYDELIQLVGDTSLIPDLTLVDTAAVENAVAPAIDVTPVAPGADATATAQARVVVAPVGVDPNATLSETNLNPDGGVRLPTYTPVPNIGDLLSAANTEPTATPVPTDLINIREAASNLPPITPIALLGGLGIVGFLISLMRKS